MKLEELADAGLDAELGRLSNVEIGMLLADLFVRLTGNGSEGRLVLEAMVRISPESRKP